MRKDPSHVISPHVVTFCLYIKRSGLPLRFLQTENTLFEDHCRSFGAVFWVGFDYGPIPLYEHAHLPRCCRWLKAKSFLPIHVGCYFALSSWFESWSCDHSWLTCLLCHFQFREPFFIKVIPSMVLDGMWRLLALMCTPNLHSYTTSLYRTPAISDLLCIRKFHCIFRNKT